MAPPPGEDSSSAPFDAPRPFTDHLEELRRRLFWCLGAVLLSSIVCWFFTDAFIRALSKPAGSLVFLRPAEAFVTRLKMAGALGFFFSLPVWIYHFWSFVGVALTVSERRVVLGALPFSYLLFAAGAALAWFAAVPAGMAFLLTFGSAQLRPLMDLEATFQFAFWTTLGLGLLFQIPVVVAALARWGFVTAGGLRRYKRHAALGILAAAALLTPGPDVVTQLILAVPAYVLFEVSILLARWLAPRP
jgi:sec-independent protein translocase protein TatC